MLMNLLRDLAAKIIHGPTILSLKTSISIASMSINFHRMLMVFSPLLTLDLLDICTFCKLFIL